MVRPTWKMPVRKSKRRDARIARAVEMMEDRVLFAAFTPGDLVVYRVGTGTGALSSSSTAVFLDEYSPGGTLVQSIAMPTAAGAGSTPNPLTATGTTTNEGFLTLSANGQNLLVPGYAAAPGVPNISFTATGTPVTTGTITAATTATPTVLTVNSTAGMVNGQQITISGVGNVPNGTYFLSVSSTTKISLFSDAGLTTGVAGSAQANFTTGGTWSDPSILTVAREVGIVSGSGSVDTTTTLGNAFSTDNIYSATSADGQTGIWASGLGSVAYTTADSSANATTLSSTTTYAIEVINGQLYVSTGKGSGSTSTAVISQLGSNLPTSGTPTPANLPGITGSGLSGTGLGQTGAFAFATLNGGASPDTIYAADNYNDGVDKYSLVGGTWQLTSELGGFASGSGNKLNSILGLAAQPVAGGEQLFMTTATGVYSFTDTSGYQGLFPGQTPPTNFTTNPNAYLTTLATAASNEAFRGIAFVPQPAGAPTMATQPVSQANIVAGTNATFTASAFGANLGVQWYVNQNDGTGYQPISGATFNTLTIPASLAENNYTYEAKFTNSSGSVTSNPATLTVIPGPALGFPVSTFTGPETAGQITVTVHRFGDTTNSDTVQWATSNGTAIAGTNFGTAGSTAQLGGTLTFPAGSTDDQTFNVPVIYTAAQNGTLTINVQLSNVSGTNAVLGTSSAVILSTLPQETVNLSSATYTVNDTDSTGVFSLVRTGPTTDAGAVPYTVTNATGGAVSSGTVSFNAGSTVATDNFPVAAGVSPLSGTITGASNASPIVITTASTTGLSGLVTVSGVGGDTAANGNWYAKVLTSTTFALYQDAALSIPVVGNKAYTSGGAWISSQYLVTLGSGITGFTTGGAILGSTTASNVTDVHAAATTLSGTASNVTDIETSGPYSQSFAPVVGDVAAGTGSFGYLAYEVLEFSPSTAPGLYPALGTTVNGGGISSLSLQMYNTDASGSDNYSGHPGNFNVYFLPDADATTATSTLMFSTASAPTGLASGQFKVAPVLLGTFSFNNTAGYDTYTPAAAIPASVVTALVADLNAGSNFRLAVTPQTYGTGAIAVDWHGISSGQTPILSLAAAQTVNQTPEYISFTAPTYTVNENAGTATISLTRTGANISDTATVNYVTADGTAVAGENYTATSNTATFQAGSATTTFTIPITDVMPQGGDKTLTLTLNTPGTGSTGTIGGLASQSTATLTIVDSSTASTETLSPSLTFASDIEKSGPYDDTEFKAEGTNSITAFASFGAADFNDPSIGAAVTPAATVTGINSITLSVTDGTSNAPGQVDFYLVPDSSSNITVGTPQSANPHFYDSTQGIEGVGTQFGTPLLLGKYNFTDINANDVLTIPLNNYNAFTEATLINDLNNGVKFRIVATPESTGVDADWIAAATTLSINVQEGTPGVPTSGTVVAAPASLTTGNSTTLSASGFGDTGGTILGVNFYRESNATAGLQVGGDTLLGSGTASAGTYTIPISTVGLPDGGYTYYAVALDSTGAASPVASTTVNVVGGPLVAWNVNNQPGGTNNFGASPLPDTISDPSVSNSLGLTRGSGIGTTGSAAANAWGGTAFYTGTSASPVFSTTGAAAVAANQFVTFGLTVQPGDADSLGNLELNYRRSGTGPSSGLFQYQLNGGSFVTIEDDANEFPNSSSGGASITPINLSGISALQNLPAGTAVVFRIVPYNATGTGGTWYINDGSNNMATDLVVNGTVSTSVTAPTLFGSPVINGNNSALAGVQRSTVSSIVYTFSQPVNIASTNAFSIAVVSGQAGTAPTLGWAAISPDANGASTQWVVTFSGSGVSSGSIANGVYAITINAASVTGETGGLALAAGRTDTFWRLFGDYGGQQTVNSTDKGRFNLAFGTSQGAPNYIAAF
ncbi:MAG TPA: Calx-beta domain-containing protein, partial [Tepidisphaeraceae bacterium]|nr:Calx-beta domain-containing protein [Tepidisphaeraceae bacterium]